MNQKQPRDRRDNKTIAYLRKALRADQRIDALIERAQRYEDKATRATSRITAERQSGTGSRSNVEDAVCALVDLSRELIQKANALADTVREIEAAIDKVPDDKHRDLLKWRYLNGWTWERITEGMGRLDVSWTHQLHGRALLEIKKITHPMENHT